MIDGLLAGKTINLPGEFSASGARLDWAPGRLPIAIAGGGPRAERLAIERADWLIVAGRPVADMPCVRADAARHAPPASAGECASPGTPWWAGRPATWTASARTSRT